MITEIPAHLQTHPLIKPLRREEQKGVIPMARKSSLMLAGEATNDLFIVLSGRVGIQTPDPKGAKLPLTTALIGQGQLFGFDAFIKKPYVSDAVAERDATLLSLPRDRVIELFNSNELFAREFVRQLTTAEEKAQEFRLLHEFGNGLQRVSGAVLDYAAFGEAENGK